MNRIRRMTWTIEQADVMDWLATLPDEYATAVLCDPPYGLSFMGKDWDHGVPSAEVWREVYRVLKPGAVLLAFGGTRTWHRLAVNIEDAGFELYDTLMWLHGQGFPKGHNLAKNGAGPTWEGYNVALKPAWEPCLLFRKPRRGTYAQTAVEHGAGALNIDGCRVGVNPDVDDKRLGGNGSWNPTGKSMFFHGRGTEVASSPNGRWPANLALVHDEGCGDECTDTCPVRMLGEQSGELTSNSKPGAVRRTKPHQTGSMAGSLGWDGDLDAFYGDTGTAARFFYQAKASRRERDSGLPDGMRNGHPTVKPIAMAEYLARLIVPPEPYRDEAVLLVPYSGSGSEMIGAIQAGWRNVHGCELEPEYVDIAERRLAHWCKQPSLL